MFLNFLNSPRQRQAIHIGHFNVQKVNIVVIPITYVGK